MRLLTYKGKREAQEPIRYEMPDGRAWEFPGDLPTEGFMDFLDNHAEAVMRGEWSFVALRDFLRLVRAQNPAVVAETGIAEFGVIAADLFNAYLYGTTNPDNNGSRPEDPAEMVPSTA